MKIKIILTFTALTILLFVLSSCSLASDPTIKKEVTTDDEVANLAESTDKKDSSNIVTVEPTNTETTPVTTVVETTAEETTVEETTAKIDNDAIEIDDYVSTFTMSVTDANDNTVEVRIYGKIVYKILSIIEMGNASSENSFSREDWINDTLYNLILEYVEANSPMTFDEFKASSSKISNYVMQNKGRSASASFLSLESFEITNLVKEN